MNVSEEKASAQTLPASPTQKAATLNSNTVPDVQVTNNAFTEVQTADQSTTPAVIKAPANAATVPTNADPPAGQTLETDTMRDGNMAVPGRGGGNGTRSRGGLSDALRSAADQISSSISTVTSGLTGGTTTGNTNTGGSTAGESGTGGSNSGGSNSGGSNSGEGSTGGGSNSGEGSTGGRHRVE
jgi:hypothetical protein